MQAMYFYHSRLGELWPSYHNWLTNFAVVTILRLSYLDDIILRRRRSILQKDGVRAAELSVEIEIFSDISEFWLYQFAFTVPL